MGIIGGNLIGDGVKHLGKVSNGIRNLYIHHCAITDVGVAWLS